MSQGVKMERGEGAYRKGSGLGGIEEVWKEGSQAWGLAQLSGSCMCVFLLPAAVQ